MEWKWNGNGPTQERNLSLSLYLYMYLYMFIAVSLTCSVPMACLNDVVSSFSSGFEYCTQISTKVLLHMKLKTGLKKTLKKP